MCCMSALSATAQENKRQLVILHTNDTHSTVMPLSENLNDTMKAGRGGFLRRIAMVKEERTKDRTCCCSTAGTSRKAHPTTHCIRVTWRSG